MWLIYEKKGVSKIIKKLPREVLRNYEVWKRIVEMEGPYGLRKIKGFHDEALKGQLKDKRSSRLNKQWRIIYKYDVEQVEVYVTDIHPHHY